jgi:hypothetical protein
MKPLVILALSSNLTLIIGFAVAYSLPRTRPYALRFFRWLAWLNLTLWVAQAGACSFNPNSALQVLTGVVIPTIEGIIPLAATAASLMLPGEAALITEAQTFTLQGLKALQKLIQEYEASPNDTTLSALNSGFNAVHDNLAQLLQAGQVKDAKTSTKITAIVNAATQDLASIESLFMAKHPQTVAAAQAAQAG